MYILLYIYREPLSEAIITAQLCPGGGGGGRRRWRRRRRGRRWRWRRWREEEAEGGGQKDEEEEEQEDQQDEKWCCGLPRHVAECRNTDHTPYFVLQKGGRGGRDARGSGTKSFIIYVHESWDGHRWEGGGCRGRNFCNPKYDFHDVYKELNVAGPGGVGRWSRPFRLTTKVFSKNLATN